jgi:DNA-binding MarR family transcriptional regulator
VSVRKSSAGVTSAARELVKQLQEITRWRRQPLESAYAEGNLTGPQRGVMHVLVETPNLSLKELSARVGLAHSTVSGIVDRLEERGMLVRSVESGDRRATRIAPSPAVREFMSKNVPALEADPIEAALRRATPAQRETIRAGIALLHELLARDR